MWSWSQLANKQLTPVGQWAADIMANDQLISVNQWAVDVRWLAASCLASHFLLSPAFSVKVCNWWTNEWTEPGYYKFRLSGPGTFKHIVQIESPKLTFYLNSVIKLKITLPSSEWCGIQLCVPGGRSLLNVWARSIYIEMRNVFTVFLFIFCERLVIPMLFLLYSLLILPIWVPALCSSCCALMWCLIFLQYSPLSFQILVWRCLKLGQFSRT